MPHHDHENGHGHGHQFTIYIDGEPSETSKETLTANEILALGGLSSDKNYLVEIKGKEQSSFQDNGDKEIHLHEGSTFISVFTGPTPVSDTQMKDVATNLAGAPLFAAQLRATGYDVIELPDRHVKFPYTVHVGKHTGLQVEMGFIVPADFPMTPPSGPHVSVRLHQNKGGGTHPTGGIHPSEEHGGKHFGSDWQYWSRPHPDWTGGPRTAMRYMAFIEKLWTTQ